MKSASCENNFQTCYIYLFQRNADVSKEFCIIWKTKNHTFFEQGLFWSIKYLLQEKNAYSAKSCYICRRDVILFQVKLLVFNACHVFRFFFLQPVPSCKKYGILSDGYALIFWIFFWMFTCKEITYPTSSKWKMRFPRKVTCFDCFNGMPTIEATCIFCLRRNAAPFEWEGLFEKPALVK